MDENIPQNTDQNTNKPNSSKGIIYVVIALLIIAGLAYAYINSESKKKEIANTALQDIVNLPDKERLKALEDQVKALQGQAAAVMDSADSGAKYTVLIRLAEAQIALEKYSEAISTLDSIPEDKKNNSRVPLAYGFAYKGLGENDKAKENLKKSLDLDETQGKAWVAFIELHPEMTTDQLKNMYKVAIDSTKSNLDVMISYAKFSEKIGDKATAIAAWETAINHDPANESKYREEINRLRQ